MLLLSLTKVGKFKTLQGHFLQTLSSNDNESNLKQLRYEAPGSLKPVHAMKLIYISEASNSYKIGEYDIDVVRM